MDAYLRFLSTEKSAWPNAVSVVAAIVQILWSLKRNNQSFFNFAVIKRSFLLILKTDKFRLSDGERNEVEINYTSALLSFLKLLLGLSETLKEKWEWLNQLFCQWDPIN